MRRRAPRAMLRSRRAAAVAAIAALVVLAAAGLASAHLGNISYADFTARGREVSVAFRYAAHLTPDLAEAQARELSRSERLEYREELGSMIDRGSRIEAGGKPCRINIPNLAGPDSEDNLTVLAYWTCDTDVSAALEIEFHPLESAIQSWQTIASLDIGGQHLSTVLSAGNSTWKIGGDTGPGFSRFFRLGAWHIWTGYDHLLFLVAVLLAGGGLARLAGIVTSFTIAHSLTLGAAATGLVRLPVAPVEALIAVSIVFVATENILGRGADRRALVTFGFGLVHGFGFASVLAETALPTGGILVPLLAFNLGVEAGQLVVVAAVVPLLAILLRGPRGPRIRIAISALIALAGAAWATERIAAIVAAAWR